VNFWVNVQRLYIWFLMAGLLVQGAGSLLMWFNAGARAATPLVLSTIMNGNPPHAWLHIVWGTAGLIYLAAFRSFRARVGLGFAFGTFYTLLGLAGLVDHHLFGMRLELPENIFHLTVGPSTLLVALLARRAQRSRTIAVAVAQ
jgi:hypothetical protein